MLTTTDQALPRSTPEAQGMASAAILDFIQAVESQIDALHSVMLLRHGHVIAEGWWSPYRADYPHMLFSLSKSFTATAVGLAIEEGHFSLDDSVVALFPDDAPTEPGEVLAAMQVRHLLSMSTGQAEDTWAYMENRADGNWTRAFFDVPVLHPPGTHFLYNTGATYMLAAVVQQSTGQTLLDFLEPRLFAPLGIENAAWDESPQGIALGGIGLKLKTEDVARFGQLYLQNGQWQGQQLMPQDWVEAATVKQVANGDSPDSDWAQGYAYQFWRCRHQSYRGDGAFGQYCIVMPEQDAVLAITGGVDLLDMQQPLDLVWELLLPAMQSAPLPDDAPSQHNLAQKLSSLHFQPVQGAAGAARARQVSGRNYKFDANDLGIARLSLTFDDTGCTLRFSTAAAEETIHCGYDSWQMGQTALFQQPWLSNPAVIAASGAWSDDDRYSMQVRLVETPFVFTLVYDFLDDELMLEATVNVSFASTKTLLMTARID